MLSLAGWDATLGLIALAALGGCWLLVRLRRGRVSGGLNAPVLFLGLVIAFFAAASPLVSLAVRGSHVAYMTQLELLISVSPVLLVLGLRPFLLSGMGGLRWATSGAVLALALGIWLLVMYGWHLPAMHALAMGSRTVYALQLLSFLAAGTLFWLPVVALEGIGLPRKLGYLALAQAGAGVLAAVLIWYPGPIYEHQHGALPFGLSHLADQRISGAVMMVVDMLVASTVAGWILLRGPVGAERQRRPSSASEGGTWRVT